MPSDIVTPLEISFEEGSGVLARGLHGLCEQMTTLPKYDDLGLDETSGWYEELIARVCAQIAEREALAL